MAAIPKKAETRIRNGLKTFQRIIDNAKSRDVNEADTVTIVADILSDVCGYDKYTEITSEYVIRNTYCDLAIKIDEKPVFLIEVKAIGIELKSNHLRQALGYASSEGVEWVILTNGDHWQAHRVIFAKPIKTEIAFDFMFSATKQINELIDYFFLISKEGVRKSAIVVFHEESQITNRFMVAAAVQTEPVLSAIRKQLCMTCKKVKVEKDNILQTLLTQVLKREVLEGEDAAKAQKCIRAAATKTKKQVAEKAVENPATAPDETIQPTTQTVV